MTKTTKQKKRLLKTKEKRKDFEKKRNILKNWEREQKNKKETGEKQSLMPVQFKRSKKIMKKSNKVTK